MASSVRSKDHGWADFQSMIEDIRKQQYSVKVGVLDDGRKGSAVRAGGLTNAQIAAVHEFGAPSVNIPERSFIRSTFAKNQKGYITDLGNALKKVFEKRFTVDQAFNAIGAKMATDIKKAVTVGPEIPPPNTPVVLKRKMAKGTKHKKNSSTFGEVRTLIDTGRMIASVSWALVKGVIS